jgi:hypothetical protein
MSTERNDHLLPGASSREDCVFPCVQDAVGLQDHRMLPQAALANQPRSLVLHSFAIQSSWDCIAHTCCNVQLWFHEVEEPDATGPFVVVAFCTAGLSKEKQGMEEKDLFALLNSQLDTMSVSVLRSLFDLQVRRWVQQCGG